MAGLQHDIGHRLRAHEISTLNICSVAVVRTRQNEKLPLVLVHVERQVIGALLTDVGYRSDDRFGRLPGSQESKVSVSCRFNTSH
jgi:hypothetical protein